MSEREQQTARESLWFGWGLEAWKNFQELAWNKAFCGPIKHLALRAVPKHKNYFLPRAQLLRKHLFWDETFFTFKKLRLFNHRYRHDGVWNAHKCLSGLNNRELLNRNRIIIVVEFLEFFAMSPLINLPLHIYSRPIRVEDKSGSLFFGCISSYQQKFLANCAK